MITQTELRIALCELDRESFQVIRQALVDREHYGHIIDVAQRSLKTHHCLRLDEDQIKTGMDLLAALWDLLRQLESQGALE